MIQIQEFLKNYDDMIYGEDTLINIYIYICENIILIVCVEYKQQSTQGLKTNLQQIQKQKYKAKEHICPESLDCISIALGTN